MILQLEVSFKNQREINLVERPKKVKTKTTTIYLRLMRLFEGKAQIRRGNGN
jgi:hypothetical protein